MKLTDAAGPCVHASSLALRVDIGANLLQGSVRDATEQCGRAVEFRVRTMPVCEASRKDAVETEQQNLMVYPYRSSK